MTFRHNNGHLLVDRIRGEFGPYRVWEICHDGHLLMDRIMKSQHVDPEEAVQIHMDIQANEEGVFYLKNSNQVGIGDL
ncbi:N-acyl-phosphatidylethanolamine-hydrolyzing phospholipase D-like [Carassius auratus]|uniref:N-acyl-phosphatidylethanolamine-hydrolyzing phospholipase D-like n=1 Tax=Carassius auratus TaxID=7957 RepID=A0A6P6JZW3_CARAU|nr:N-acyl-phosphatidylethanolamine-hydrolyzing phospholipase D-like [Carassius auratus]